MGEIDNSFLVRIVDDDEDIRDSLSLTLEGRGWQTASYDSVDDYLQNDNFEKRGCILLDVRMPKKDGLYLQELMNKGFENLPIIFITAYGELEMAVNVMKKGAYDFLTKPVNIDVLCKTLENVKRLSFIRKCGFLTEKELAAALKDLSGRDKTILKAVTESYSSNKEIADCMGLTPFESLQEVWRPQRRSAENVIEAHWIETNFGEVEVILKSCLTQVADETGKFRYFLC